MPIGYSMLEISHIWFLIFCGLLWFETIQFDPYPSRLFHWPWGNSCAGEAQELPVRKQIHKRPSGFELNLYGQDCTPAMKNSSSEGKTKNTQDCQKLKFYQIQINSNINHCFPKQFWCWSWRNGLDYSNIPFFVVYGKSSQGITRSCTSLSQPPQPCCPSGWAGGSAGWDCVTVFAELSSSC